MEDNRYALQETEELMDELWEEDMDTPPVWTKAFRRNKFSRRQIARRKLQSLFRKTRNKYGAGVYFDRWKKRLVQYSIHSKSLRVFHNRHFRRIHNSDLELTAASGGSYKKFSDYRWEIW